MSVVSEVIKDGICMDSRNVLFYAVANGAGDGEGITVDTSTVTAAFTSCNHTEQLIKNMEQFRHETGYTDLVIAVENLRFPCHKVILAAGSPYFRTMFASGMEESHKHEIKMEEIDASTFETVLAFIYTGRVDITDSNVQELFVQAQLLQIQQLVELCVMFFQDTMQEENCLAALTLADCHCHRAMYKFTKNYICDHFLAVVKDEDFCRLSVECVSDLLRQQNLNCISEEQVFEAAIRWLDYSPQRKDGRVDTILRTIKFPLVENSYLMDTVSSNKYLAGDRGRELLNAAILYHTVPSRRHLLPTYQVTPRYSFPYFECVVLLGGRMGDGLSNDVKCFRADTSDFYSLRPLPFKRRNEFAACTIGDEIYVSGGLRSDEFWKYDPTFRSWLRGCSLTQPRRRHGMGAVDRSLYVLGGFDEEKVLDSIEVWRPKACSWKECGWLVMPVENMGFVAYDKHLYLFGGKNRDDMVTSTVQCFNTLTMQCSICASSMPVNDMCVNAAVLSKDIYVVGLEGFFRYRPEEGTWELLPNMLVQRDFVSLCVLNEKLYAFGGRRRGAKDNLYCDSIDVFDLSTGVWSNAGSTPVPMYFYGCVKIFLSNAMRNRRHTECLIAGTDGTNSDY